MMEQDNDYYIIGWKQRMGPGGKEKKEGRKDWEGSRFLHNSASARR
jgi:hypothetical protein